MTSPSASDVAAFMLDRLNEDEMLYQEVVVYEIQDKFGDDFVYTNDNGNLGINRTVLSAFRRLTDGKVVWSRGERYWRFKEDFDSSDSRVADE